MASVHQRGDAWLVRWRDHNGRNRQVSVSSERRALGLKVEVEDAIDREGRYDPRRVGRSTGTALISSEYIADCARRRRPATVHRYAQMLDLWTRWLGGDVPADEAFTHERLSAYHQHLSDPETGRHLHRRSPETVRKHIEAIELLWKWAWGRQARGSFVGVPQPDSLDLERQAAPHKLAPTWEQMDAVIEAANGWQRRLYVVLRCTGLRVQQAMGLRWDDLDLGERPGLMVRPELGKTRQERRGRWVPLAPVLVAELATWGVREEWVVPCPRAERVARARDADRAWARSGAPESLWSGCGHHAFRAGFQSGLRALGADRDAIEHLVGHSRGDVVERYVGPDALPLVATVALVPPIVTRTAGRLRVVG